MSYLFQIDPNEPQIKSQRSTHVSRSVFREHPEKFNLAGWVIVLYVLNMKMRYILIGVLFMAGCNASKLALSDNTASNISAVASYIPSGTDAAIAVKLMSDAGFTCRIERGKTFAMSKGTTPIGEVGPMDFVWCDKQQGSPVPRRWQVILILDEQDKVKDHSVSTGLVGP